MLTCVPVPAAITDDASGAERKVAVLICHGMGQQVPFETLGLVMGALLKAQERPVAGLAGTTVGPGRVRIVAHEGKLIPLVHVCVTPPAGATRRLTLFECYWAPVTAGRVRLANAIIFYLRAGFRGLRYALGRSFERRIGSQTFAFRLGLMTQVTLALALNVLLAVTGWVLALELLCVLVLWRILALPGYGHLPLAVVAYVMIVCFAVAAAGGFAAWVLSDSLSKPQAPKPPPKEVHPGNRPLGLGTRLLRRGLSWVLVALPLGVAVAVADRALRSAGLLRVLLLDAPAHPFVALGVLAAFVWLLVKGRAFLVEYTGDVAAYMSAHEVSRFAEIRNEIQARCCAMMEYVYGLTSVSEGQPPRPYFDEVMVVGHSLGSVVAYDTLNEMLARQRSATQDFDSAERTSLFLTFGSPLDKIAFIFRSQRPDEQVDIREELAAERQPMILGEAFRPRRWVNLSNPCDWIGADIDYFDLQPRTPGQPERSVHNLVEQYLADPGTAHGGYWRRRAFQQVMLWAAAGCPDGVPSDKSYLPAIEERAASV